MKRGAGILILVPLFLIVGLAGSAHAGSLVSIPAEVFVMEDEGADALTGSRAVRDLGCSGGGMALLTDPSEALPASAARLPKGVEPDLGRLDDGVFVVLIALPGDASSDELGAVAAGTVGESTEVCRSLTSDGTRREGVLSPTDVETLIHQGRFDKVVTAPNGNGPVGLHHRHLRQRAMYVPVGLAAGIATLSILAFALFAYYRRERLGPRARVVGEWACFAVPSMAVGMLACGHLETPSYFSAGVVIAGSALFLPGIALAFRRRGPLAAPFVFGMLLLAFFAVEAAMGWPATLFTLLGGTALDGARFYGLPNAFMGLLLGGAMFMAPSLRSVGAPLIVAVGLLAGLPQLGANMGAAITIMFAAGLWIALSTPGWRGIGAGVVIGAAGLAVVVAAHVMSDAPTHVTTLAESGGLDPGSLIERAIERLGIGIDLLRRSPVGITYLIATPIVMWFVVKPRGGWREAFEAHPAWRSAMLTILAASVVAYFVNDTGVSAVGQGFAMALGGILYVPIARASGRIGAR